MLLFGSVGIHYTLSDCNLKGLTMLKRNCIVECTIQPRPTYRQVYWITNYQTLPKSLCVRDISKIFWISIQVQSNTIGKDKEKDKIKNVD